MSDIISEILDNSKKKSDSGKNPGKEKASTSGKNEKPKSASASSSKSESSSCKKLDSANPANPVLQAGHNQDALSSLANVMQTGFQNLERILLSCTEMPDEPDQPDNYEVDLDPDNPVIDPDVFQSLSAELESESKLVLDISLSLAQLAEKTLRTQMLPSDERFEKYFRPANLDILAAPTTNKPIWVNMSSAAKSTDISLQAVQREFLLSAIPVLKVMNQINEAKEDLNMLYAACLLYTSPSPRDKRQSRMPSSA